MGRGERSGRGREREEEGGESTATARGVPASGALTPQPKGEMQPPLFLHTRTRARKIAAPMRVKVCNTTVSLCVAYLAGVCTEVSMELSAHVSTSYSMCRIPSEDLFVW